MANLGRKAPRDRETVSCRRFAPIRRLAMTCKSIFGCLKFESKKFESKIVVAHRCSELAFAGVAGAAG
jgi:hypothetical protein